jgi:hypothetical protein
MEIVSDNSEPLINGRRGRPSQYNWNEWLQHGKRVRLIEGVDFTCRTSSIRQQAYNQAMNRHGTVSTHIAKMTSGMWAVELTFWYNDSYLAKKAIESTESFVDEELPMSRSSSYGKESIPNSPGKWGPPDGTAQD